MDTNKVSKAWMVNTSITIAEAPPLKLCLEYRSVEINGQEIALTTKEFDILALLIFNPKRVFTFEMMSDMIWDEPYDICSHKTITNHISNLRKKLAGFEKTPVFIKNVYNVGYKFDLPVKISIQQP